MVRPNKVELIALFSIILSSGLSAQDASGRAATANEFIEVLRLAKATSSAGHWSEAAKAWERVVQTNPVNEEYWQELAEAHYKSGEFKQAIPAFQKVLDLGGYCFPSETPYNIARSFAGLKYPPNLSLPHWRGFVVMNKLEL